jgi:hypothetical protein
VSVEALALVAHVLHFGHKEMLEMDIKVFNEYLKCSEKILKASAVKRAKSERIIMAIKIIIKKNIIPAINPVPAGYSAGVKISPIMPAISISTLYMRWSFLGISSIPIL